MLRKKSHAICWGFDTIQPQTDLMKFLHLSLRLALDKKDAIPVGKILASTGCDSNFVHIRNEADHPD